MVPTHSCRYKLALNFVPDSIGLMRARAELTTKCPYYPDIVKGMEFVDTQKTARGKVSWWSRGTVLPVFGMSAAGMAILGSAPMQWARRRHRLITSSINTDFI